MRPRAMLGVGIGLVVTLSIAPFALAGELAFTYVNGGSPVFDGLMGNIGQRTDPATVVGIGYVHATQADVGALGGDFVAIGTANGVGVPGTGCANDYDAKWSGYYDGQVGGTYFCEDFEPDAFAVGSYPTFSIEYKTCPLGGGTKWVLFLYGATRGCVSTGTSAAFWVVTMLETTGAGTVDRNIDVNFINLKWSLTGQATWVNYGNVATQIAPNYSYTYVSATSHNIFLAPYE
jgi:hypothetical protein